MDLLAGFSQFIGSGPDPMPYRYGRVSAITAGTPATYTVGDGGDSRQMVAIDTGVTLAVGDFVVWLDSTVPLIWGKVKAI